MTPARIKELRALLEAGTKGPWRASETWRPPIVLDHPDDKRDANGNIFWGYSLAGCDESGAPILPTLGAVHNFPDQVHANAALIVAAVNELPALLDEVERLRGAAEGALATMRRVTDEVLSDQANDPTGTMWITVVRSCRELSEALARQALEGGQ